MIQANELRVGNFYYHNAEWSYREKESIFEWNDSDWYALGESTIFLSNVFPIPLTSEILKKCGFIRDDNDYDVGHIDYCEWYEKEFPIIGKLITSSNGVYLFDEETDTLRIKHLHQLQNLHFVLTGEELPVTF